MDVWEAAKECPKSIEVQKFSASTYPPDVKAPEMPEDMKTAVTKGAVGLVWRARVGRARRWWYGWCAEEALSKALSAQGYWSDA